MIMYFETKKLEYNKILDNIKIYAQTDLGKKAIFSIEPLRNEFEIKLLMTETFEAKTLIERYDETPLSGVLDLTNIIKKSQIGSTLSIDEFMRVVSHQEAITRTLNFVKKAQALEIDFTNLLAYYNRLNDLTALKKSIDLVIDRKGEIYDNASSKLAEIRKKITFTEERINNKMQSLLKSEQKKLSDGLITIRNNRLVLPVKLEYKNSFKGILHDSSSSGETVFIEPMACVDMNNDLARFFVEEVNEIERILSALTIKVSEKIEELKQNQEIFVHLDLTFAKAKYALNFTCNKPNITKDKISLLNARHPLIDQNEVVGNNITFHKYNHIIITGPNTGGKTVALKTLGLLALMAQSGMLIPVDEGSDIIIFSNIFADIGDEQSIEQSLSTFSSHIENITKILSLSEDNSLVLLDEIGSGTDPKEGASLAIAIIDHLRNKKLYSMITTHYPELKTYAYNLDNAVNASVEFDINTLRPTYHLRIGIPGTSNAIKIARRLGLNKTICEQAESVSLTFDTDVSKLIKKLEDQSLELDLEVKEYRNKIKNLEIEEKQLQDLKNREELLQNQRMKEFEAAEEARLEALNEKALDLIEELDELKKTAQFKEHELAKLKHDTKTVFNRKRAYKKTTHKSIQENDIVNVLAYQKQATVIKKLKNNQFEVAMGNLSLTVKEKEIEFVSRKQEKIKTTYQTSSDPQVRTVKVELDLHGKRYEEAMLELDKFVDDCLLNNLEFAYVVHGIGTGALKKGVEKYAKSNPQIKSFRRGTENEGGLGVTVIQFK
ncbi:MAG: endonuclease MutS2 [Candidatus Izemoplasmatales bacterium]